jgi:hypothetical protein
VSPRRAVAPTVAAARLSARIRLPAADECPGATLIVGPCRSGTTALLRAAAATGHRAYFQPVKRLIRKELVGEQATFEIEPSPHRVVIKETLGPFVHEEATFDPVRLLAAAGYPIVRADIVVVMRQPVSLYRSWERLYGVNSHLGPLNLDVFVTAFEHSISLYHAARASGLTATAFTPDAFAGADPARVVAALFARHNLRYDRRAVEWGADAPPLDRLMVKEPEPEIFRCPGALNGVRHSIGYRLVDTGPDVTAHPARVAELVPRYETFRQHSAIDLEETP